MLLKLFLFVIHWLRLKSIDIILQVEGQTEISFDNRLI